MTTDWNTVPETCGICEPAVQMDTDGLTVRWTITSNTSATTNWVMPALQMYTHAANYIVVGDCVAAGAAVPAPAPAPENHRGAPQRLYDRDQQFANAEPAEMIALQLLRKMIPHDDFRRYLRNGFLSVRGGSGIVYQVSRDWGKRVVAWYQGEKLCALCIHIGQYGSIPPTDEVVGKMLMIEYEEARIWARSNLSWYIDDRERPVLRKLGVDVTRGGKEWNIANDGVYTVVQGRAAVL